MLYAAILAGGSGTRIGGPLPKQFMDIGGVPVLLRTVRRFVPCPFDGIYIACNADWLELAEQQLSPLADDSRLHIIPGGSDRTGSLLRVLCAIEQERSGKPADEALLLSGSTLASGGDIIATHDAARPFVSVRCISESIEAAACGCAGAAIPSADTILCSEDGDTITAIPKRTTLYRAQTPQTFVIGEYLRHLAAASEEQRRAFTDVCGVFTAAGAQVRIVPGDDCNLKITTPLDIELANCIAAAQDKAAH